MKKIVIIAAALSMSFSALACTEIKQISGLTDVQRQELIVKCNQTILDQKVKGNGETVSVNSISDAISEESLTKIQGIAKVAGDTVTEVAKSLNIAVNDFVKTPVGALTAALAIWYVAGDSISAVANAMWNIVGGILLFILATIVGSNIRKRMCEQSRTTVTVPRFWGLYTTQVTNVEYAAYNDLGSNAQSNVFLMWVLQAICYVISLILVFA